MTGKIVPIQLAGAELETFESYVGRVKTSMKAERTAFQGWEFVASFLATRPFGCWRVSVRRLDPEALESHRDEFLRHLGWDGSAPVKEAPDAHAYHHYCWD